MSNVALNSILFTIWSFIKVSTSVLATCDKHLSSNGSVDNWHQGRNTIVLAILELLEFKTFFCRPTMVANLFSGSLLWNAFCQSYNRVVPEVYEWTPSMKKDIQKTVMFIGSLLYYTAYKARSYMHFKKYLRTEMALIVTFLCPRNT